jgi:hypothetical protein
MSIDRPEEALALQVKCEGCGATAVHPLGQHLASNADRWCNGPWRPMTSDELFEMAVIVERVRLALAKYAAR